MRLDNPRFAKVGKYTFTSKAFMSEPQVMTDGTTKRSIIGYHSDRWAIHGGAEWDDMRLRQFAHDVGVHVDYESQ